MNARRGFSNITVTIFLAALLSTAAIAQWQKYDVGTSASFRGLDVVSSKVVWASGTGGTVIRTTDGGKSWKVIKVPGAEKLDFRDIEAFGKKTAYILSIGNGDKSRIYKTADGGDTWQLQFRNSIENAFFDSIAFWDKKHGVAQSDPVDGRYVFFETKDGKNWTRMPPESMPAAKEGEAAFAASGTCIVTQGKKEVYLITGGMAARVFRSKDRGRSWKAFETPMLSGATATGIFGIAVFKKLAVIVGGDFQKPNDRQGTLALSVDGGETWKAGKGLRGYRSGVAFLLPEGDPGLIRYIAVGPTGSEISSFDGNTWERIDNTNLNAVQAVKGVAWAVGPNGYVGRMDGPWVVH